MGKFLACRFLRPSFLYSIFAHTSCSLCLFVPICEGRNTLLHLVLPEPWEHVYSPACLSCPRTPSFSKLHSKSPRAKGASWSRVLSPKAQELLTLGVSSVPLHTGTLCHRTVPISLTMPPGQQSSSLCAQAMMPQADPAKNGLLCVCLFHFSLLFF